MYAEIVPVFTLIHKSLNLNAFFLIHDNQSIY